MTNDRDSQNPPSSEELIRRARESYSTPPDAGETTAPNHDPPSSVETRQYEPRDRTRRDDRQAHEYAPPPPKPPDADDRVSSADHRGDVPGREPTPPGAVDEATASDEAPSAPELPPPPDLTPPPDRARRAEPQPPWPPSKYIPGGTVPVPPPARPSGTARLFSVGRWIVGGIFLFAVLGQCFDSGNTLDDLSVGDCFQDPGIGVEVSEVEKVGCSDLHDFELFTTVELGDADRAFPGTDTLFNELESECAARFSEYVGHDYLTSVYDFVAFTPVVDGWRDGDRKGLCALYLFDPTFPSGGPDLVQVAGTARNSGR